MYWPCQIRCKDLFNFVLKSKFWRLSYLVKHPEQRGSGPWGMVLGCWVWLIGHVSPISDPITPHYTQCIHVFSQGRVSDISENIQANLNAKILKYSQYIMWWRRRFCWFWPEQYNTWDITENKWKKGRGWGVGTKERREGQGDLIWRIKEFWKATKIRRPLHVGINSTLY